MREKTKQSDRSLSCLRHLQCHKEHYIVLLPVQSKRQTKYVQSNSNSNSSTQQCIVTNDERPFLEWIYEWCLSHILDKPIPQRRNGNPHVMPYHAKPYRMHTPSTFHGYYITQRGSRIAVDFATHTYTETSHNRRTLTHTFLQIHKRRHTTSALIHSSSSPAAQAAAAAVVAFAR